MGGGGEGGGDVHVRRGIRAALAQVRDRGQQRLGVFVLRVVEDLRGRPGLHDEALAHDGDPVGEVGHHAHVVGDEHNGAVQFVPQVAHEVKDFGLDGHVEGGGGLVGNQQLRVAGERLRDHGALALPAGKLVRVGPEGLLGIGQFDKFQHAQGPEPGFFRRNLIVQTHSFHNLRPHGVDRVQGRHRLLEDHRDVLAAHGTDIGLIGPQQLPAGELDTSGHTAVTGQQAQQRHRTGTLSGPGLPHDGEHFAGPHLVVQADRRRDPFLVHAEIHAEVPDLQDGFAFAGHGCRRRIEGDEVSHDGAILPPEPPAHRGLVLRLGILNY